MSEILFDIRTKGGELTCFPTWEAVSRQISLDYPDHTLEVTIRPQRSKPSHRQYRYYWGVLLRKYICPIMKSHHGQEVPPRHMDTLFLEKFAPTECFFDPFTGEHREKVISTSGMNSVQLNIYIENVREWARVNLDLQLETAEEYFHRLS